MCTSGSSWCEVLHRPASPAGVRGSRVSQWVRHCRTSESGERFDGGSGKALNSEFKPSPERVANVRADVASWPRRGRNGAEARRTQCELTSLFSTGAQRVTSRGHSVTCSKTRPVHNRSHLFDVDILQCRNGTYTLDARTHARTRTHTHTRLQNSIPRCGSMGSCLWFGWDKHT